MGNTMLANDLHTVLTTAVAFAGKDASLPMLQCVRLDFGESQVVGAATDRFVLGVQRADYTGEAFGVLIGGEDVKTVVRISKTARAFSGRTVDIELERRDESVGGDVRAVTFRFSSGEAITVQTADHSFPKYSQLIPADSTFSPPAVNKGFNAAYLAKFAKVTGSHNMRVTVREASKPTVVTVGDDFVGLIMPVRLGDGYEYKRPSWLA